MLHEFPSYCVLYCAVRFMFAGATEHVPCVYLIKILCPAVAFALTVASTNAAVMVIDARDDAVVASNTSIIGDTEHVPLVSSADVKCVNVKFLSGTINPYEPLVFAGTKECISALKANDCSGVSPFKPKAAVCDGESINSEVPSGCMIV
jgi:hypothetical protein